MPALPGLYLSRPTTGQRFHVELWCEKTTVNDVLDPLACENGCNLVTGSGELSAIACVNVVKRARASGKPVRVLYQRLRSRWQIDARGGREEDRVRDPQQ